MDLVTEKDNDSDASPSLTDKCWLAPASQEERDRLRAHNMDLFEKKYKSVFMALSSFEPKSELVFNENGDPDMVFAGAQFYDGDIKTFVSRQMADYWRNPNRLSVAPPIPQHVDGHVGRYLFTALDRMKNEVGAEFSFGRSSADAFYGIIMGIGLGHHIPEFIEKTNCRNLFLLEPNFEGLYHSLELLDWAALMIEMQDRDGDIFFFVGGSAQQWMDGLRYQTRATNTNSFDGTYVYAHYNNPLFLEFSKKFNKESHFLLTGLGFFYDEQIMLRNTYHNMAGHNSRIYVRAEPGTKQQIPAIIVGCGPSLDKNIEDIKRVADNAVIFSCGSALGPLMDAGVKPDFQMELENINVMRVMLYAAEKHDLSGICLVSSSTVEREIKDFFDEVVYYFRPALCPYPIFSYDEKNTLAHPDPTVVNVGLSFAQEMGFREYYFFGTDLGQKDSDQHHALSSFHYSDKAQNEILQDFSIEVPANFGGKAMTSSGLFWALDTVQRAILYTGNTCRYFNCSNGARINRAMPKLSRTLDLPTPEKSRADTVRDIIETFPVMTSEEFDSCWDPEKMVDAVNDLMDTLIDIAETSDMVHSSDYMIQAARLFYKFSDDRFSAYAGLAIRGSVNQALIAADYYLARITDDSLTEAAQKVVSEELVILFERMRNIIVKHIRAQSAGIELREELLQGLDDDDGLTEEQRQLLAQPVS